MFYGRGAGGGPTASAVLGDVIDAAVNLRRGTRRRIGPAAAGPHPAHRRARVGLLPAPRGVRPARRARRRWPACSAATACRSARWSRRAWASEARCMFITHEAREADVQATLHDLRGPRRRCARVRQRAAGHRRVTPTSVGRQRELGYVSTRGAAPRARLRRRPARRPGRRRRPLRPRAWPGARRRRGDEAPDRALRRHRRRRHVALRRRRPRARRVRRASSPTPTRTFDHPDVVPAAPARATDLCLRRAVPRARRWRSRTSPCSSSAACSSTSWPAGASGSRSSAPPRATPARRPSRRCRDRDAHRHASSCTPRAGCRRCSAAR